jgi:protein pelota
MKVHHREINYKNKSGLIIFTAEEPEDLWHIYNLMEKGDVLTASTIRNVKKESSTGSRVTERKHFKITIKAWL